MNQPIHIHITGPAHSGKTTAATKIAEHLKSLGYLVKRTENGSTIHPNRKRLYDRHDWVTGQPRLVVVNDQWEPERTVVTCVYCGHEYPDGTPTAKAESLAAHVKVCDKHPMKRAIDALAALVGSRDKAELKGMRDQLHLLQIRPSERAPMLDAINVLLETLP